jgi:hypothetical protein
VEIRRKRVIWIEKGRGRRFERDGKEKTEVEKGK